MRTFLFVCLVLACGLMHAQVNSQKNYVDGHYRLNGTYVEGHYRTNPNGTVKDNYSTYPNVNPYTGQQGTRYRYDSPGFPTDNDQRQPIPLPDLLNYQSPVQEFRYEEPQQQFQYQQPQQQFQYQPQQQQNSGGRWVEDAVGGRLYIP